MAAQMLRMLRNPDLARRLAEAARETVRSRFLWRNQIRAYIAVYERHRRGTRATSAPSGVGLTTTSAERRVTNVLLTCASDAEVGGVQTLFRDLVHWLEHEGRHVHLVYPARLPGLRPLKRMNAWGREASYVGMPGLVRSNPLISISILIVYIPLTFFDLARLIRKEKIDVINGHFLAPYFIHLAIAARVLRVPLVISVLGSDVGSYARAGWMGRILYRHIVGSADRIVACSEALAKRTTAAFPEASGKTTWVYCALDDSQHTETRHNEDVPQPYILCVCRHVHVKGVDVLLKAFARIHDEVPDISLVLVGDGPLLSAHQSLAARLGISHRVVFRGEVAHADVPSFFSRCALFVLPSRSEGFSITLLEAAYHGRPIVCTRVGGSPELISHGNNGLLVAAEDSADLAANMLMLLRNNEFASRLGAAAHETVRGSFLWKDRIQDYIDIYEGRPGPSLAPGSEEALSAAKRHGAIVSIDPR
jgi:glycosyltransferase involved in cell wall biosynthesis